MHKNPVEYFNERVTGFSALCFEEEALGAVTYEQMYLFLSGYIDSVFVKNPSWAHSQAIRHCTDYLALFIRKQPNSVICKWSKVYEEFGCELVVH